MKICVSDRCFFPKSAFMNSRAVVKLAKSLGYEQVEFHPTWGVWLEFLAKGKLSCQRADIASFHIDWRQDTIQEGASFWDRLKYLPSHLFPSTSLTTRAMRKLERKYKKPVVIHWQKNIEEYKEPILELHGYLPVGIRQLEKYFKAKKIGGVVVDTDKFSEWMKANELDGNAELILKRLIKKVAEVHFRFKHKEDIKAMFGEKETKTIKIMKKLLKLGYRGRIVVEAGWPDAGRVASFWQIDKGKAKKLHSQIIDFLKILIKGEKDGKQIT